MNKFTKLLIAGLVAGGISIPFTGCVTPVPFVPPEGGGDRVVINDAYDWNEDESGSTRPDLNAGYEAVVPPSSVEVKIAETCAIKFKNGEKSITKPAGSFITAEDFDAATLNGHTVGGFAVLNEDGKITSYRALKDFALTTPATVVPYFALEKGDPVSFGSKKIGDYYYDENGTDVSGNEEYAITSEKVLVDNYPGTNIKIVKALGKGAYFRSVTVLKREPGQTYTYCYTFKNNGQEAVSFTVYQMNGGHDYADPAQRVAADGITVQPGESKEVEIIVRNTKNDANTLTLIRLDEDITALDLDVIMTVENSTPCKPAKITLNLPEGFTVSPSYKTDVNTNELFELPSKNYIKNETGHKLLGWVYSNSNQTRVVEGVRIKGDIAIEPLLTEDVHLSFVLPEGLTLKETYKTLRQTTEALELPTADDLINDTGHNVMYWEYAEGGLISDGTVLTEDLVLRPVLTKDVYVTLELPDGVVVSDDYVKVAQEGDKLVLPTADQIENTTGNRIIRWVDADGNEVTGDTVLSEDITIKPELTQNATITVALPTGWSISADYKTAVQTGDTLVLPTNEQLSGVTDKSVITGWFIVGGDGTKLGDDYMITQTEFTIAPILSTMEGYTVINVGSGANSGYNTDQVPGDITKLIKSGELSYTGYTTADTTTKIVSAGGFGVGGSVISANKPVQAGAAMRFDSVRTAGAGIYEFSYAVENKGTSKLHFSIYQINASSDYKSGGSYYRYETQRYRTNVELNPGEGKQVIGQYDFTGQTNGNWITYLVVEEDAENFNFGIAVGYKSVESYDNTNYPKGNKLNKTVKLTYNAEENGGITVSDNYLNQRVGRFAVAPKAEDLTVPAGVTVEKWQIIINGTAYDLPASTTSWQDVQIPSSGATLKAVLATAEQTPEEEV